MTLSPEMEDVFDSFGDYDYSSFAETRRNGHAKGAKPAYDWRAATVTACDLRKMIFKPVRYIVPGFIPEGLTLIVGRPKIGKSWLALDLCLAAASDRFTLGEIKPAQGDVLYLALEDGKRRLQRRLSKLLPTFDGEWPSRLTLATDGGGPIRAGWTTLKHGASQSTTRC
jgi:predicted ATP-dependent serine protease